MSLASLVGLTFASLLAMEAAVGTLPTGNEIGVREFFERRIIDQERIYEERFKAADTALKLYHAEQDRRLAELNNLRADVVKDRAEYVTRVSYDARREAGDKWQNETTDRITRIETKAQTWTIAIGLFFLILQTLMGVVIVKFRTAVLEKGKV